MIIARVLDGDLAARHGGKSDKGADLDHVRQHAMLGATEFLHTVNVQQVAADALDLRAHAHKHVAQLLQVGLAGGIENGGAAFR